MVTKVLYTAEATATGGRDGNVRSSDGQLFAAGYAACFHSALLVVAQHKELDAEGSSATARVGLGPTDDGPGFGITVTLRVDLPRLDQERAERLVRSAHKVCPYSNAIRDNVQVELEVEAAADAAAPA